MMAKKRIALIGPILCNSGIATVVNAIINSEKMDWLGLLSICAAIGGFVFLFACMVKMHQEKHELLIKWSSTNILIIISLIFMVVLMIWGLIVYII